MNNLKTKIILTILMIIALILGCIRTENAESKQNTNNTTKATKIGVTYNSHIQNLGWEKDFSKQDGQASGTEGKSLRLEAMKIKLNGNDDIKIKYVTHIQNIGWQDWKHDGEMAGTQGRALRLEAIKIQLVNTDKYSVMYRTHIQNIGWQDWKYDGEMAGTEGKSLRLEAIEIKIINKRPKGILFMDVPIASKIYYSNDVIDVAGWKMSDQEGSKIKVTVDGKDNIIKETDIKYCERPDVLKAIKDCGTKKENPTPGFNFKINASNLAAGKHTIKVLLLAKDNTIIQSYEQNIIVDKNIHIKYSTHVQNIGWQNYKQDGQTAGTYGQSLRVEAIKIHGNNLPKGVNIKYQTHVQGIGWQEEKVNNQLSGTEGKSLRIEAIKIKLTGTEQYSVMYRTHVQNIGWQPWCYDGEMSGTIGNNARLEAIEIKIVKKYNETKNCIYLDNPTNIILNKKQQVSGWIMTTVPDTKVKVYIDNIEITNIKRTARQDVLNQVKGYGDESIYNKTPGFETEIDFSKYTLGKHTIKVQILSKENKILLEQTKNFDIKKPIITETGTYGVTGLRAKGDSRGTHLKYYKYGNGPNVFFGVYAIHGYEDLWAKDGWELVSLAEQLYSTLKNMNDYQIADKWTIYILPGVNQDGLNHGTTNNGPGRTTLYSKAPGHKGIDLNRCWQVGNTYKRYTDNRNYNGTAGFQAYEAQYLRDFLLKNKSKNGQTVLVDLHGWTQQLIGDPQICSYYAKTFAENDKSGIGRYGEGYLVNWARMSLGSPSKPAKSALIELPHQGIHGHQSVIDNGIPTRYLNATIDMLRNI